MDGNADGRWMCELSNWTGKAYKIPRTLMKECEKREDLHSPGVYFLFGKDDDTGKSFVYIGESEDIIKRIYQHFDEPYFWTECVVFISKDEHMNKAHIKYLEHRFYAIVTKAKRYVVKNGNVPKKSQVSEAEQSELEEFIFNVELLMSTLGHRVFEAILESEMRHPHDSVLHFVRKNGSGGRANGRMTNEGFVVMKGSYIFSEVANYLSSGIKEARQKYAGIIDANGILQEDVLFSSPSSAAAFVCGKNVNGLAEWKDDKEVPLKALEFQANEEPV
jgi:hypothetical protein